MSLHRCEPAACCQSNCSWSHSTTCQPTQRPPSDTCTHTRPHRVTWPRHVTHETASDQPQQSLNTDDIQCKLYDTASLSKGQPSNTRHVYITLTVDITDGLMTTRQTLNTTHRHLRHLNVSNQPQNVASHTTYLIFHRSRVPAVVPVKATAPWGSSTLQLWLYVSMRIGSLRSINSPPPASTEKLKKYDVPAAGKNPSRKYQRVPGTMTSVVCRLGSETRPPGCLRATVRSDAGFFPPVLIDLSDRLRENPMTWRLWASMSAAMLQWSVVSVRSCVTWWMASVRPTNTHTHTYIPPHTRGRASQTREVIARPTDKNIVTLRQP